MKTPIEWTDHSVNPIRARLNGRVGHHCVKVSPGCTNCYASRLQARFGLPPYELGKRAGVECFLDDARLEEVLRRKKPTRWFWCDMTDLFGEWVPDEWLHRCFAVMALTPHHTHQVLTKRPERMREYIESDPGDLINSWAGTLMRWDDMPQEPTEWPLRNVWLGVSAETQEAASQRIPLLLATPAAVRFISAEPLLGPLDLTCIGDWRGESLSALEEIVGHVNRPALSWVIVGGESGDNSARSCHVEWIRSVVRQCRAVRVPVFVKQMGRWIAGPTDGFHGIDRYRSGDLIYVPPIIGRRTHLASHEYDAFTLFDRKGGDPKQWPEDLRIREWPRLGDGAS